MRIVAASFAIIAVVTAAPLIASGVRFGGTSDAATTDGPLTSVYVVLLYGYPRADTLSEQFDFDNSPFLNDLEARGFAVASDSKANYNHTWMTVTSLLNGAYIGELIGDAAVPDTAPDQFRALTHQLNEAVMLELFRDRGYRIEAIPPPFMSLGLRSADEYLDSAQLTAFEYSVLENSFLSSLARPVVAEFAFDQQRDRFQAALHAVASAAGDGEHKVLFAHIFSPPHAPLLFGANGEHLAPPECVPSQCPLWEFPEDAWDDMPDQVRYLNTRLLETVDAIIADDPDAAVILLSDHGVDARSKTWTSTFIPSSRRAPQAARSSRKMTRTR